MLKSSLTAVLPEFNGDLVEDSILTAYLEQVETSLPDHEYKDNELAKVYWVAMSYQDSMSRASDLDGSSALKSEKIDDVSTTYKDAPVANPYTKLFYTNVLTQDADCEFFVGFMVSS